MKEIDVLTTGEAGEWMRALDRCSPYDFYHLPQYHLLAEEGGEGIAHLALYNEGDFQIALPFLVRTLDGVSSGLEDAKTWRDATSVYGYAGPVRSHADIPEGVVRNFQAALQERLSELRVVAIFSRLHPFLSQGALLAGLGERQALAKTVSIDLTLPAAVQRSHFRKNHKEGINRLRRLGLTCMHDPEGSHLEDFVRIYHETMRRVGAAPTFFFRPTYFQRLWKALNERIHLFACMLEGRMVCGGLFLECDGILQYHLGGTLDEALHHAPMKLLVDEVRLWATQRGMRVFHLGGGATPDPVDSLYHFKKGFSDRTHEFSVWRWVLFPGIYRQLCEDKTRCDELQGLRTAVPNYFPAYRAPTVPCQRPTESPQTSEVILELTHTEAP